VRAGTGFLAREIFEIVAEIDKNAHSS